ncbi:MAG: holo-ACP synthase [Actinobacteria bacterium]|nr:holo-ACP synthase [Actinomycetota bacterium]
MSVAGSDVPGAGAGEGCGPGAVVGVGVDLVDVARVAGLLARRRGAEERLFTAGERSYCRGCAASGERFAARFAAKEAVGKALGTGVLDFREIEVLGGGRPSVRLAGRTALAAGERGVAAVEISLTHTATYAAAIAVALAAGMTLPERSPEGGTS